MFKRVFGLCLLFISTFLFSMAERTIFLGKISNQSNNSYTMIRCGSNNLKLDKNEAADLQLPLLNLLPDPKFPDSETIRFECVSEASESKQLFIRAFAYNLVYIKYHFDKKHFLKDDKPYVLNVTINEDDCLVYELIEK